MRIDSINVPQIRVPNPTRTEKTSGTGFGDSITKALSGVNELQADVDGIANKMAAGESVEIHQAMIAMQKASTSLQFTVQVRNKVIEAYQEIMKMQV